MTAPSPFQIMHSMSADRSGVDGKQLTRQTRRRVLRFARPYRTLIIGFVATIVAATFLGLLPPLLIREVFDVAIVDGDTSLLNWLFVAMIAAAAGEAVLSLVERWLSSRIGEGLIFDLRVRLFDHVQRMPLAFFTRTQTGTLISRLNNDVIGAQRAFTGTLGTVVGNVITLGGTLIAMLLLEWRLTLIAVVILPVFVLPARRVGRNLQDITREGMNVNASMNNTMTERFNVAGALLVKLFGRHDAEATDFADRAGRVRDIGVRSAMYSRVFLVALTLVGAVGTALVYWLGGHLAIDGDLTPGTLVALGLYLAGRRRSRALSGVMTMSMGLSNAKAALVTVLEFVVVLSIAIVAAFVAVPLAVRRLSSRFDPAPALPPDVAVSVDWLALVAMALASVSIVGAAVWWVEWRASRRPAGEVLRDVG